MILLTKNKKVPSEITFEEKPVFVEVTKIEVKNYPVNLRGYGVIKPISVTSLASEVNGIATFINPALKSGGIISAGEILLTIDDLNYSVELCKAEVNVEQLKSLIEKTKKQQCIDVRRINTLEKNKTIEYLRFEQRKKLFKEHKVGTKFEVDSLEKAYNLACDSLDQLLKIVSLYPIQINEAKNKLRSAEASLSLSKVNLEKCHISSPFSCRVKSSSIQVGEFVSVAQEIAVLADDSILEIEVSIDSNDIRQWVQFDTKNTSNKAWFGQPKPVDCEVTWGKNASSHKWIGKLDRIAGTDQNSQTIRVVVRVDTSTIIESENLSPLVEGMFCTVNIPGRLMKNVYRLPKQAVNFENKVYICNEDNRLKTVMVNVVRIEGKYVFVDKGINPTNRVIKTHLVDPLENTLLKVDGEELQKATDT